MEDFAFYHAYIDYNSAIHSFSTPVIDIFAENISVSILSERVFLSENQFSRVFLRETGLTPYQYIKEYRFDVARVLLKSGLGISETAQQCGFMSGSAFSSSFKKRFGCSPLKFMQKCSF